MNWRVKLLGDDSDLAELSKSFNHEKLKIYKDGESYILCSSDFDLITKADNVLEKSEEILNFINGGSRVIQTLTKPIQVDRIELIDDKGKRNTYIFSNTASLGLVTYSPTILVNGKVEETYIFKDLPNWVLLAKQDRNAAKIFNYLETGSNDITTLYKIYEIIETDVGGKKVITENKWASSNRITLFRRTANSPDAIGAEARHGVQKDKPPQKPMSLNESKSFISQLVKCWLNSKQ